MLNLTRQERLVIKFLVVFFLIGGAIHLYKLNLAKVSYVDIGEVTKEEEQFKVMADKVDSMYISESTKTRREKNDEISRPVSYRININTAEKDELMKLPEIGSVTADRIILYRMEHERFNSVDELINVRGIGKKTLEKIKGEVTIE